MANKNLTGTPEVRDYLLGRGRLFTAALDASDAPTGGWRDMGNVKDFGLSATKEVLKHFSTRAGLKSLDREIVISQEMGVKFTLEEMSGQNLADWVSGTLTAGGTNAAVAGFTEYAMIPTAVEGGVVLGRWYEIKNSSGVRAYGIVSADLTVEKSGSPDTTLVEGTDYVLDLVNGMIFFKSTAVNCAAGDQIDVTLAANGAAKSVEKITSLDQSSIRGAVMFVSVNANDDSHEAEFFFHKVNLTADGDAGLIGDEIAPLPFTGACEKDVNGATLTIRTLPR